MPCNTKLFPLSIVHHRQKFNQNLFNPFINNNLLGSYSVFGTIPVMSKQNKNIPALSQSNRGREVIEYK